MATQGQSWTVTGQRLDTALSDSELGFVPVWKVSYRVVSGPAVGTTGYVNVPAATYNADTVKAAIDAQVAHLHNVASL